MAYRDHNYDHPFVLQATQNTNIANAIAPIFRLDAAKRFAALAGVVRPLNPDPEELSHPLLIDCAELS
jgi:hypothetical protein